MNTYTHLEDFIFNLYLDNNIKHTNDLSIYSISTKLNIDVFFMPLQSVCMENIIILDERVNSKQQWQNFCHELSHFLLHNGNQLKLSKEFVEYQEYKANNFMYHAAVPTFMLDQLNIFNLDIMTIYKVQQLFNVEYEFALKRLQQYINNKNFMLNWNIRKDSLSHEIHIS